MATKEVTPIRRSPGDRKAIGWEIDMDAYLYIYEEANRTGKSMAMVMDEIILRSKQESGLY